MAETDLWFGTLAATVRVDNLPASRRVVAIELPVVGEWRVCGAGTSNASGIATLPITGLPTSRIYAVAIDDWGRPFVPGMTVAFGDVIRPTQFLGWMYQVTAPGVMPGTEPEWWNGMAGIPQPVGTAMMQAIRHYQPIAHGPVSDIEWEVQEFDPHWDKVVTLLHFDGTNGGTTFTDQKGSTWAAITGSPTLTTADPLFGTASLSATGPIGTITGLGAGVGTGEFCIECFVFATAQTNRGVFDSRLNSSADGIAVGHENTAGGQWQVYFGGSVHNVSSIPLTVGSWVHVALERVGTIVTLYIGGVSVLSFTSSANVTGSLMRIGAYFNTTFPWAGKIDEFRATVGVYRYGANFTPPTEPFPNVGPPL